MLFVFVRDRITFYATCVFLIISLADSLRLVVQAVMRRRDGDIKICGLSDKAKQPFEILGFESLYDFCADVPSAKKQFDEPVKGEI